MGTAKFIEDLPDEILLEIFSHLSFEDLVQSAQYVTLRWRALAHNDHLWKDLVYSPPWEVCDGEITKTLQQAPKLQILLLNQRGVSSSVLHALIENGTHLKTLKFHPFQRFSFISVGKLVQNCQNIEVLYTPDKILSETKTAQYISQLENLKVLGITGWGNEANRLKLKPLADGCPALQYIDIRYKQCNVDDLEYFLNQKHHLQSLTVNWRGEQGKCVPPLLSVCKSLKTLHLDNYSDIDSNSAFESLKTLRGLTALCFSSLQNADINRVMSLFNNRALCQLVELKFDCYDNYEDALADVIALNCPLLKVLFIRDCYALTDTSLQSLQHLKQLEYINLRNCSRITGLGMAFLCKCKQLKLINLSGCYDLTEECMKNMTELSRTLQILVLDYCNIKELAVGQIPSCLSNLLLLSVNYCQGVDQDALEELKVAMPQLIVRDKVDECATSEQDEQGEGDILHNYILFDDGPSLLEQLFLTGT